MNYTESNRIGSVVFQCIGKEKDFPVNHKLCSRYYLAVSAQNYFLGQSLFAPEKGSEVETVYTESLQQPLYSSDGGVIQTVSNSNRATINEKIQWYFVAKLQGRNHDSKATPLEMIDEG